MDAQYILVAATAMEMQAVIQGLGAEIPAPGPGKSAFARVRDLPVHLEVCGIGPLAAAFCAGRLSGQGLLAAERCLGLLSLGIAGTYAPNVAPIGSAVLADREIWPEYGLATETGVDAKALGFPLAGKKDDINPPPVWDSLALNPSAALAAMRLYDPATAPRLPENPLVLAGPSVTVAAVSGTRSRARDLAARHTALTENMEGFPLALAASRAGVPFAEIRTVSNIVGDRSPEAWNIPAALAALTRVTALAFSL